MGGTREQLRVRVQFLGETGGHEQFRQKELNWGIVYVGLQWDEEISGGQNRRFLDKEVIRPDECFRAERIKIKAADVSGKDDPESAFNG